MFVIYVVYTHSLEGQVTACITFVVRACNNFGIRKVMFSNYCFRCFVCIFHAPSAREMVRLRGLDELVYV